MKPFLLNTLKFFTGFLLLILTVIFFSNKLIDRGNYFSVDKNINYIILGPSQPECAFNDSLIANTRNLCQSGDSYFYTYFKVKKLLENNPQIKSVFIEFSNNLIDVSNNELIWSDKYVSYKFQKYAALMSLNDAGLLLKNNWRSVLNAQTLALKNNLLFLIKHRPNFISENNWGAYLLNNRAKTDSLINASKRTVTTNTDTTISESNIDYLEKTVQLCQSKQVNIFLLRCPVHPIASMRNEEQFNSILKSKFSGAVFLDFKNYPLKNEQFGDFDHLNYKGANEFSRFFDDLLKDSVVNNEIIQDKINNLLSSNNK